MTLFTVARVRMGYRTVTRRLKEWWPWVVYEMDRPDWSGAQYANEKDAKEFFTALEWLSWMEEKR